MWFKKKKQIQLVDLSPRARADYIPSNQWRTSPELTSMTRKLLATPETLAILEVLKRETPKQMVSLPLNAGLEEKAALGSLEDGYYICLNKLLSLQDLAEETEEVEATYDENNNR
jgi:hypothetical protein